jgi:hypothetical protein
MPPSIAPPTKQLIAEQPALTFIDIKRYVAHFFHRVNIAAPSSEAWFVLPGVRAGSGEKRSR